IEDVASGGSLRPVDLLQSALPETGPLRADFTYKLVENVNLSDRSLERSMWTGAVLRNCRFRNVSFARSDFAGAKFVDCEFIECDFEPDELRSCFLTRTNFVACKLVGLHCISSQWID